ncbi:hypothetical protein V8B97DRAFT_2104467 [Scleroderma yunnanense]
MAWWTWNLEKNQDEIVQDPQTDGATFVPIILSSDKMIISVTTSQNNYWPVYLSIGNVHNHVSHAHCNAIVLLGFLPIPKAARKYLNNLNFHRFKKQVFHMALAQILQSLKPGMTTPKVLHFLLACIVQNWCGQCTAFPDNLDGGSTLHSHALTDALRKAFSLCALWDEWGMDVEIKPFTDKFPYSSIYLLMVPDILHQLIKGHVPDDIVHTFQAFLEFCYLVHRDFHQHHKIFCTTGVHPYRFSLPHQHSLLHYEVLIRLFSTPNGLCTSITESKHTYQGMLRQMLLTNQHLDNLAAVAINFEKHGMLKGSIASSNHNVDLATPHQVVDPEGDQYDDASIIEERPGLLHSAVKLAQMSLNYLHFPTSFRNFCPTNLMIMLAFETQHPLAASNNLSGIGCTCLFVNMDDTCEGMKSMDIAHILCFCSLPCTNRLSYPCALVHWFDYIMDECNELTGMWMVKPSFLSNRTCHLAVIHLDTIVQVAHLIPVFGGEHVPPLVSFHNILDVYCAFYINHFVDYHTFELSF